MVRPGIRRLPRKVQLPNRCRIEPAFTDGETSAIVALQYVVQSDDVAVVTLEAAEVAAREGDTMLRVPTARMRAMPSTTW